MELVLKEGLLIQKVVDEVVILEPETGDYYTLNETGAMMLKGLQQGKSITDIKQAISKEFAVAPKEVEQDFDDLLIALEKSGLAHRQDA